MLVLWALGPAAARAEVADSAAGGFTVKIATTIEAPAADVYRKLVRNVGEWWDPVHTFSGDAHNLSIEDKPMGCYCEKLPGQGGGVRHMEVIYFVPGKALRMTGAIGPMQGLAAAATMTFELAAAEGGGTKVSVTYAVAGYLPGGMNTFAAPVDGVLTQQLTRLKNYVERGDPKAAAAK